MAEHLTIAADLMELVRLAAWTEGLCAQWGLPGGTVFGVNLCLEEAVSNVINHGEPGARGVTVTLDPAPEGLLLTIEDHGPAFDPLAHDTPAMPGSLEEAHIGGMGIHLMRKFTRSIAYTRSGDANRLSLRFDPAPAPG